MGDIGFPQFETTIFGASPNLGGLEMEEVVDYVAKQVGDLRKLRSFT